MKVKKQLHNYRHGDICLFQIEKLPKGSKASKSNVLLAVGSGGNPHTFDIGIFYPAIEKHDFIIGYLKAKNTKLLHAEHSPKGASIADGIYEVRRQVEFTHSGMKQVID